MRIINTLSTKPRKIKQGVKALVRLKRSGSKSTGKKAKLIKKMSGNQNSKTIV